MSKRTRSSDTAGSTYREGAARYNSAVGVFNLFSPLGFNMTAWRREAVSELGLGRGDTVVEIGCGTGLNFALLQEQVGPEGRILGVDLSEAMLNQAQARVAANGWRNVELVTSDAAQFTFPPGVDGVFSTFALVLIPECGQVVGQACQALRPGRHLVVLDMAWPASWPRWFRHMLFFLRSFGVTDEVLERRPWETVWRTMEQNLVESRRKAFWMGGLYLASGARGIDQVAT